MEQYNKFKDWKTKKKKVKMLIFPKFLYRLNGISIKITQQVFVEIGKPI